MMNANHRTIRAQTESGSFSVCLPNHYLSGAVEHVWPRPA